MKLHRSILLSALCALALPVAAQQRTPPPAQQGNSIRPVDPPQTAPETSTADMALVPSREVAAPDGLATYRVDTRSRRPISPECMYASTVRGTLRAPRSVDDDTTIRDANLSTVATITCRGQVVTTRSEHLSLLSATARQLSTNLEKGLGVSRPGQRCIHSVALRIDRGRIAPERAISVCKAGSNPLIDRPNLADNARFGSH